MPELPEVENTKKSLEKLIINNYIINIWTDTPSLIRKNSLEEFRNNMLNRKITSVKRIAKNIIITFDGGYALLIHLKMTGHLLIGNWSIQKNKNKYLVTPKSMGALTDKMNGYIHFIFYLDDGRELALSDLRKFAKLIFNTEENIYKEAGIYNAGKDALLITLKELSAVIKLSSKNIKTFLMDQTKIAGIGNIYADDILFKAQVHPLRKANSLSLDEIKKIHISIKEILLFATKIGGTSISDYRDIKGEKGGYGDVRMVYRRDGKPCYVCGSLIKRIKINNRSARFCPTCQSRL